MHPKPAPERIVVVDDGTGSAEKLASALAAAGFDVRGEEGLTEDVDLVVRVSMAPRARSGILRADPRELAGRAAEEELQEKLEETQRMESIAQLAGGIAHDFNNILAVISICADEALEAMPEDDASRSCLLDIRHAVERGAVLTRDLLSFSRRDCQERRVVDMNDVVAEVHPMLERVLGEDIALTSSLAAVEPFVRIDPAQWSCVLVNLAINARQAMPDGGKLSIRTRSVFLDPAERGRTKTPGTYLEIEVEDTGCGIAPSVQPKIFDPFFTTRGIGKGTGLGLSVVYGVVEQSGGWIEVVSGVGAGATFRLYVPVVAEAPVASSKRPAIGGATRARVLLVEDEDALRRIAHRMLERQGYAVFEAASAEEALAMFAEPGFGIDLLVADVMLPGKTGRQLAEEIAKTHPHVPVLFTSGYTNDPELRKSIARSEVSFLAKPYTTRVLTRRVEDALSKKPR